MFSRIRHRIARYYLRKRYSGHNRQRIIKNISQVKSVGILYTLDSVSDYEEMEKIVTELQQESKEVKVMGYVSDKNLIARFLPKLTYDFISDRDLNWFYKPVHERVKDFAGRDFDLLLDLSLRNCMPLIFIDSMSVANCRVGCMTEEKKDFLDIMIDFTPIGTVTGLYTQIKHYLSVINISG